MQTYAVLHSLIEHLTVATYQTMVPTEPAGELVQVVPVLTQTYSGDPRGHHGGAAVSHIEKEKK